MSKIATEKLETCLEESKELLQAHWDEVGYEKGMVLNPDYGLYKKLEQIGALLICTLRDNTNKLIGYYVATITDSMHHKGVCVAYSDIFYITPKHRGPYFKEFMLFVEEQLKDRGVQFIINMIPKDNRKLGSAMELAGYELKELHYSKNITKGD